MIQFEEGRDRIEVLAEDFSARIRSGERPRMADYVHQYPDLEKEIRELFPTIESLERMRLQHDRRPDGKASLGPRKIECLGDFSIVREIGRGGMGIVYEAEQLSLGRRVAVKVLPHNALMDEKHLKRFRREARTAARLHHTNIVPVFGVGDHDGVHYYVMQLIRGVGLDEVLEYLRERHPVKSDANRSLSRGSAGARSQHAVEELAEELIQRDASDQLSSGSSSLLGRPASGQKVPSKTWHAAGDANVASSETAEYPAHLHETAKPDSAAENLVGEAGTSVASPTKPAPPTRRRHASEYWHSVARIGRQVAEALHYAHGLGTLHRDIKPGNLLLDGQGTVWVTDFGLARAMDHTDVSRSGDVVGTLRYMAPEQLRGEARIASDIYGLGLTLYELLTLEPAFDESRRKQALRGGQIQHEPIAPRKICSDIPRDLETIVMKCLAFEPERRYADAEEIAEDLRNYLENRPILARRSSPLEQLWRWCRRNPALASTTALAATLLVAVAITASVGGYLARRSLQRAEVTSQLAMDALDSIYQQLSPSYTSGIVVGVDSEDEDASAYPTTEWVQVQASPETARVLENLLVYYDKLASYSDASSRIAFEAAVALRRVGDIRQRLGDFGASDDAYLKALDKFRTIREKQPSEQRAIDLEIARTLNERGNLHATKGPFDQQPTAYYLEALKILTEQKTGLSVDERVEIARTHYLIASRLSSGPGPGRPPGEGGGPRRNVRRPRRDEPRRDPPPPPPPRDDATRDDSPTDRPLPADVAEWNRHEHRARAIEMLEAIVKENSSVPDHQLLLAQCYNIPSFRMVHDSEEQQRLARATEILTELVEQYPRNPDYRYELCQTHARVPLDLFRGLFRGADPEQVRQQLDLALEESEYLVKTTPTVPKYAQLHALNLLNRAVLAREQRDREATLSYLEQALEQSEEIVAAFPNLPPKNIVFCEHARLRLGAELLLQGRRGGVSDERVERGLTLLNEAADNLSSLRKQPGMEEDGFLKLLMGQVYMGLAEGYALAGQDDESRAAADAAKEFWPRWPGRRRDDDGESPPPRPDQTNVAPAAIGPAPQGN